MKGAQQTEEEEAEAEAALLADALLEKIDLEAGGAPLVPKRRLQLRRLSDHAVAPIA